MLRGHLHLSKGAQYALITLVVVVVLVVGSGIAAGVWLSSPDNVSVDVAAEADPTTGVLSKPCSVLEDSAVIAHANAEEMITANGSTCTYTGADRTTVLTILKPKHDVSALMSRPDCQQLLVPSGSGCAYSHPLGEPAGQSGSALVIQLPAGPVTLNVVGEEALSSQETNEAVSLIAKAVA